jgi:2Fe-2S ferredoxin
MPPSAEELEMLDGAFQVDERSRLCCQIIMTPELDGLEVELAPESLADAPPERLVVGG